MGSERVARIKDRRCIGEIYPDGMYTIERVMELIGLGRESLYEGMKVGVIQRYFFGHRVYVEGSDVIAWIKSGGVSDPNVS